MPTIRKALPADFEYVYSLFSGFRSPRPSKEEFQRLFEIRWGSDEAHVGFILEENGEAIGYLGTLFSLREINGRTEKFCNLCTWIVKEEYRSEGLPLLFQILKMKNITVTNFTGARVVPILSKFGFQKLDETLKIFFPLPSLRFGFELIYDYGKIYPLLDAHARRVFDDHKKLKYQFALLKSKDGYALFAFNKTKRKGLPLLEIHYLSGREFFFKHIQHVLPSLCIRQKVIGLMLGDHYLEGISALWTLSIPQNLPRLFRSMTVSKAEMDTLYSELQILDL